MSENADPRLALLAMSARRLLDAIDSGAITLDAPEAQKAESASLMDMLALRTSQALSIFDSPAKAMQRANAADRLAHRLLDPEDLGFQTSAEVRDAARIALGISPIETIPSQRRQA